MSAPAGSGRRTAAAVMAALAFLVLGVLVGVDHARLSRLEKSIRASEHASELARLSSEYASLASEVRSLRTAPRAVTEASFNTLKAQWDERLSALEDGALASATAHDLAALTDRMGVIETRLQRAPRKPTPRAVPSVAPGSASSTSSPPAKLDPPFLPLGIELRGGERFLSIVPAGASSIAQARALRPGDREGNWILERLERNVAEFRVEGQIQRLSVPQ
jgi:hypothetical protein